MFGTVLFDKYNVSEIARLSLHSAILTPKSAINFVLYSLTLFIAHHISQVSHRPSIPTPLPRRTRRAGVAECVSAEILLEE